MSLHTNMEIKNSLDIIGTVITTTTTTTTTVLAEGGG